MKEVLTCREDESSERSDPRERYKKAFKAFFATWGIEIKQKNPFDLKEEFPEDVEIHTESNNIDGPLVPDGNLKPFLFNALHEYPTTIEEAVLGQESVVIRLAPGSQEIKYDNVLIEVIVDLNNSCFWRKIKNGNQLNPTVEEPHEIPTADFATVVGGLVTLLEDLTKRRTTRIVINRPITISECFPD